MLPGVSGRLDALNYLTRAYGGAYHIELFPCPKKRRRKISVMISIL